MPDTILAALFTIEEIAEDFLSGFAQPEDLAQAIRDYHASLGLDADAQLALPLAA